MCEKKISEDNWKKLLRNFGEETVYELCGRVQMELVCIHKKFVEQKKTVLEGFFVIKIIVCWYLFASGQVTVVAVFL